MMSEWVRVRGALCFMYGGVAAREFTSVREIWLNCDHKKGKKKKKKRGGEGEQSARGKCVAQDTEAGEQQGRCEWEENEKESRFRHVAALLEGCDEGEVLLQVT